MPGEEGVEVSVFKEVLLLDNLSIDVRGAQGFDLSNQIVPNALYGLDVLLEERIAYT